MKLKPWYDVVKPREDLCQGRPLDASEFAVHLDKVRLKSPNISADYTDPRRFFERTFLTDSLVKMAAEAVRRLSGITTEASAVFNTMTQFGGGKTHALTLVYHLAHCGPKANKFQGVAKILGEAQVDSLPKDCAIGVFVGMEFDSVKGRGGDDGTPVRRTPWGELAWQLGGAGSFKHVAQHDAEFVEPKGDVIDLMLPADRPCLILMDEVLSYFSTYRDKGWGTKLYNFIQALTETCRGRKNCVLIVSAPKSDYDYSYTADDVADLQRIEAMLQRISKSVILSAESDACEIIRRRLFEWDDRAVTPDGRVLLPKEAYDTCREYAEWVREYRDQLPDLVNPDIARDQFLASYPFHSMTISVFERKWSSLPRFQRTRGILRVLALWVSQAYQDGTKSLHRDPMISLGTAPLGNPQFRAAVFEQLGTDRLEAAVTTDIVGKKDAHAVRLDSEAVDTIRKGRLHQKVATTIFFESNGGQVGTEAKLASVGEIRLAVCEPESDIGNIETVLDELLDACYYLIPEKTRYRFSLTENLNKRFNDRKATIQAPQIDELMRQTISQLFPRKPNVEPLPFPANSIQIGDRPVLTFVVADPGRTMQDEKETLKFIDQMTRECGTSSRTFKSALIWVVADTTSPIREEARKLLAWRAIEDEVDDIRLEDVQRRQLQQSLSRSERDLKESVWRHYKHVVLLGKDDKLKEFDLGLVNSSSATDIVTFVLERLREKDEVASTISAATLIKGWPPAFKEWPTRSVRDALYASPLFPRLLNSETIKDIIVRGVQNSQLAYVGKTPEGKYDPFLYGSAASVTAMDIEVSDDMFIVTKETAEAYRKQQTTAIPGGAPQPPGTAAPTPVDPGQPFFTPPAAPAPPGGPSPQSVARIAWAGEVPPQKWMNFYTRVLSKFATGNGLKLTVTVEAAPDGGVSKSRIDETRIALRELGLNDNLSQE